MCEIILDPIVQNSVDILQEMGYDNCNGWLTRLSELYNGKVEFVLDSMSKDLLYNARLVD